MRRVHYAVAVALAVALLGFTMTMGEPTDPGRAVPTLLPPDSKAYGRSLGEWSALHWQWAFSQPITAHPLLDTAPFDAGQDGKVLFLGGSFASEFTGSGQTTVVEREITIKPGTALFFPIFNAEASAIEYPGTDLQAVAEFFATVIDPARLYLTVDGVEVENLADYGAFSDAFDVGPVPEDNLFELFLPGADIPAGATSDAAAFGYYVMLAPLPIGTHTIGFGGEVDVGGYLIELDVTYTVKVQP